MARCRGVRRRQVGASGGAAAAVRPRAGFARLIGDSAANIALGQNTHELVTRWLSALPLLTGGVSSPPTASSTASGGRVDRLRRGRRRRRQRACASRRYARRAPERGDRFTHRVRDGVERPVRDSRDRARSGPARGDLRRTRRAAADRRLSTRSTSCRSTSSTRAWTMCSSPAADTNALPAG